MSLLAKARWLLLLAMCTLLVPAPARADGFVTGSIEYVRTHDPAIVGAAWAPPAFWFTLVGVSATAIGCPGWAGDRALLVAQSREALLLVLSAQMTGKQIGVYYTSSSPLNGYCRAGYITIGDPPPNNM